MFRNRKSFHNIHVFSSEFKILALLKSRNDEGMVRRKYSLSYSGTKPTKIIIQLSFTIKFTLCLSFDTYCFDIIYGKKILQRTNIFLFN